MRSPRSSLATAAALLLVPAGVLGEPAAAVDGFRPAELPDDGFVLSRPTKRGHLVPSGRLSLTYLNDPLVFERSVGARGSETSALVSDQLTASLAAGLDLYERAVVFASMPVHLLMKGKPLGTQPTATGFGAGDLGLGARFDLHHATDSGTSAQLSFTLPTGEGGDDGRPGVAGDAGVTVHPEILASVRLGPLWLHANVGMRWRRDVALAGARLSDALTYGASVSVPLADERVEAVAEVFGRSPLDDFGARADSPLEAIAGANLALDGGWRTGAAGGVGITRGYGSPDLRLLANVGWRAQPSKASEARPPAPEQSPEPAHERAPTVLRDLPPPPPPPKAEPAPPPPAPKPPPPAPKPPPPTPKPPPPATPAPAPAAPASATPPPTAPAPAAAPVAAGAAAWLAALAADPTGDHDGDGVANAKDECPIAPGPRAEKGCPDSHRVDLKAGRFDLKKPFRFENGSAELQAKTEKYLEEIVATLNANPTMRVRVEAHVAEGDDAGASMALTHARAAAVRAWLVAHGIAQGRLKSWGCGQTSPVAPNNVPWGRKRNERIELVLLDPPGVDGVPSSEGCEAD